MGNFGAEHFPECLSWAGPWVLTGGTQRKWGQAAAVVVEIVVSFPLFHFYTRWLAALGHFLDVIAIHPEGGSASGRCSCWGMLDWGWSEATSNPVPFSGGSFDVYLSGLRRCSTSAKAVDWCHFELNAGYRRVRVFQVASVLRIPNLMFF